MQVAHNSLTVQISFPPMPGITPTEISIGFSGPRTTQNYHPQFGFRFAHSYPLTDGGRTQRAHFSVTLTEKVPGGQRFAIDAYRDLVPLFDITVGKLVLSQTGDCDLGEWFGNIADPWVVWFDPPVVRGPTPPLLPGTNRTIHEVKAEEGDVGWNYGFGSDCEGLFTYDVTYTPWTWASLNPNLRTP